MKKMFCNDTCENLDHKKKEEAGAVVKVGQKKVNVCKEAEKVSKEKQPKKRKSLKIDVEHDDDIEEEVLETVERRLSGRARKTVKYDGDNDDDETNGSDLDESKTKTPRSTPQKKKIVEDSDNDDIVSLDDQDDSDDDFVFKKSTPKKKAKK